MATLELNINLVKVSSNSSEMLCYVSEEVQMKIIFQFLSQLAILSFSFSHHHGMG